MFKKIFNIFLLFFFSIISFATENDTIIIQKKIVAAIQSENKIDALKTFAEANKLAQNQNNLNWQIEPTIATGFYFFNNNEFKNSINSYEIALVFCNKHKLEQKKGKIFNLISIVYGRINDHQKSYEYSLKALKTFKNINQEKDIAIAYRNMADELYVDYNKNEKNFKIALDYYNKSIAISQKRKDYSYWVSALNNLATLYMDASKPQESLKTLELANEVYEKNKNEIEPNPSSDLKSDILCNKGWVYLSGFKNYPKAITTINEAINYCNKNFVYAPTLSRNFLNLTEAHINLKQYDLAKIACARAMFYGTESQDIYTQAESYLNLSKLDSINGDFKNNAINFKNYVKLKDSINNNEKMLLLEKINIQFETEKVTLENKDLQEKNATRIIVITILVFLVLSILSIFYFYFKSKKAQNILLIEKSKNLENEKKLALLDKIIEEEKNKVLIAENETQNRELTSKDISLEQNKNTLESAYEDLRHLNKNLSKQDFDLVARLKSNIKSNLSFTDEWQSTALHFEKMHPDFFKQLLKLNQNLTQNDLRQCAYIKLNLSTKEIAWILNIDANSVRINRYRIKKKLQLAENVDLIAYISTI